MYFYVDESGNTGNRLFDLNQPTLYYGLLSCRKNLDVSAERMLARLRSELDVPRVHASELGVRRLTPVYEALTKYQKHNDVRFNFYRVQKRDHAIISFFDQVFDSGMNDAVEHEHYFTPLRYMLLLKVEHLFDDKLAERAWYARINQNKLECEEELKTICLELRARLQRIPDERSRELIDGALAWAIANPAAIEYGASNQESALQISPNVVGFQQVLHGISATSASVGRPVRSIIVDRQSEFNNAQQELNNLYRAMRGMEHDMGVGMPKLDMRNMPDRDIEFRPGDSSAGLEMVDVYVWTMKRVAEQKSMSEEGRKMLYSQRHRGRTDEVSLTAIDRRWAPILDLPMPQGQALADAQALIEDVEVRRLEALRGIE